MREIKEARDIKEAGEVKEMVVVIFGHENGPPWQTATVIGMKT